MTNHWDGFIKYKGKKYWANANYRWTWDTYGKERVVELTDYSVFDETGIESFELPLLQSVLMYDTITETIQDEYGAVA